MNGFRSYFPYINFPLNQVVLVKYKLKIVTRHASMTALNGNVTTVALLISENIKDINKEVFTDN